MKTALLPITRLAVIVSGVVPAVFALVMILAPNLLNSLFWPPPFEPLGQAIRLYSAASYLAYTAGMIYTLGRNDWRVAQGFLWVAGVYNALSVVVSLVLAVTAPGIPAIVWLYILLAIIYLVLLALAWRQQQAA